MINDFRGPQKSRKHKYQTIDIEKLDFDIRFIVNEKNFLYCWMSEPIKKVVLLWANFLLMLLLYDIKGVELVDIAEFFCMNYMFIIIEVINDIL